MDQSIVQPNSSRKCHTHWLQSLIALKSNQQSDNFTFSSGFFLIELLRVSDHWLLSLIWHNSIKEKRAEQETRLLTKVWATNYGMLAGMDSQVNNLIIENKEICKAYKKNLTFLETILEINTTSWENTSRDQRK